MATGTKKKRDYSKEWEVEGPDTSYEFRVEFNKRDPAESGDGVDDPEFGYYRDSDGYICCDAADVAGCCGINALENFEWNFPGNKPGLREWLLGVAEQHFADWVKKNGQNYICHTVKGFEPIEQMLKKAGFKQTAKFRNQNGNPGAVITQWNYTHDKHKVRTKKPSSVKPRSPSVRGRPATR